MHRYVGPAIVGMAAFGAAAHADTVSTFRLDNGMDVVVVEDHRAPVVVQMVWYKIGAADESPGHSGIAHFLEHLMFQGTSTLKPGEFSATVEAQGGNDNAFTSFDYTAYYQRVSVDRLDLMMTMEADRMRNLQLTEEDVATERDVILEERGQRIDSDPGALMQEQTAAAQFLNHPYGVPVIGWRHEMAKLSRQDAFDFYSAYYAPNNAILVVAGDVDPQAVFEMAKQHYGPVAPSDKIKPRARPTEPPQLAERRLTMQDERVAQPYVSRSYMATERNPGDQKTAAALTILAELLGGSGTTSVLSRALQFDTQVAVYASASYDGTSVDTNTFNLAVVPAQGVSLGDAEAAMDKVLDKFLQDGVNQTDFDRIKIQIRAADIYARDDAMGLAQDYGQSLAVGLTIDDIKAWPEILQAVTADEVMAAARTVLNRNNAVTGWLTTKEAAQ